ncbi:MAG: ribosome silencing factor [Paludibacteraceae bacterium]|jgi:ribosome-associated protein|nr:ribosome silencing factor [Paludibacteraceae bacterium]MBR5373261.1 ribosome silencing factor [Paludibacteraceae bacterium]
MTKKILDETELLVNKIVEGIQEKKGAKITVVDMSKLENYVFRYFVICQGNSNTHVCSIADEVKDYVREQIKVKPFAVDGYNNAQWIALDYGEIILHVFLPEIRDFYSLETLWEDAEIKEIPDLQ